MPAESPLTAPDESARPRRRIFRTILLAVAILIMGAAGLMAVWAARRYQQGVELAKRAQEQYRTLNTQYPFHPPAMGQGQSNQRWQAMMRVRERIANQASPALRQTLRAALRADSLKDPRLYQDLLGAVPQLSALLETQLSSLRAEQMSAREYQWMLGRAIAKVLSSPSRTPAGDGYWGVLEGLERMSRGQRGGPFSAAAAAEYFQKQYAGAAEPAAETIGGLGGGQIEDYALDLLLAAAQWSGEEGTSAEGALKRLVGRQGR